MFTQGRVESDTVGYNIEKSSVSNIHRQVQNKIEINLFHYFEIEYSIIHKLFPEN
jgi:hypothetical protein